MIFFVCFVVFYDVWLWREWCYFSYNCAILIWLCTHPKSAGGSCHWAAAQRAQGTHGLIDAPFPDKSRSGRDAEMTGDDRVLGFLTSRFGVQQRHAESGCYQNGFHMLPIATGLAAVKLWLGIPMHSTVWCHLSLKFMYIQVKYTKQLLEYFLQNANVSAVKVTSLFCHRLMWWTLNKTTLFSSNSAGWTHAGMCPSFVHEYMSSLCFPGLGSGYWAWLCTGFNGNAMQEKAMCLGYMCVRNGILVSSSQRNCLPF